MDWCKILWSLLAVFFKSSPLLKSILIYCTLSGLLWSPFTAEGVPGSHSEEEEISSSRAGPSNASPVRSANGVSSGGGLPSPGTVEHETEHEGEGVGASSANTGSRDRPAALLEDIGDRAPSSEAQTNQESRRLESSFSRGTPDPSTPNSVWNEDPRHSSFLNEEVEGDKRDRPSANQQKSEDERIDLKFCELTGLSQEEARLFREGEEIKFTIIKFKELLDQLHVLSADGGGLRGAFEAEALACLEKDLGRSIKDIFQGGITGTSTGSLVALGATVPTKYIDKDGQKIKVPCTQEDLDAMTTEQKKKLEAYTAAEIVQFYYDRGKHIFPGCCGANPCCEQHCSRGFWRNLAHGVKSMLCCFGCCGFCHNCNGLCGPKYSRKPLDRELQKLLGTAPIREALAPVQTITYDVSEGGGILHIKSREDGIHSTQNHAFWEAGAASSAAPTYFPAVRINKEGIERLDVDGGLFENNPTLAAIAYKESISKLGGPYTANDYIFISIGTGEAADMPSNEDLEYAGKLGWAAAAIEVSMSGTSATLHKSLQEVLSSENYFRIQPSLQDKLLIMDRPESVNGLIKKANEYCKKNNGSPYSNVIKVFKREQEFIKDLEEYLNSTYSDSYSITKKLESIKELVKANNEETKKAIRREYIKQPENSFLQLFLGPDASTNLRLLRIFSHVCTYVIELSYKAAQVIGEIRGISPSQKLFHIQDMLTKAAEFCLDIRTQDPPSNTLSKLEKFFLKAVDLCTQDESPIQNAQMLDHELSELKELVQEAYWVLTEKEEEEVPDPLGKVIYLVFLLTNAPGLPEEQKEKMAQFMSQYIHYHRPHDVNMTLEESFRDSEEGGNSSEEDPYEAAGWEHEEDPLDSTRIRHRQGSEETLESGEPSAPRTGGRRNLEDPTLGPPRWSSYRSTDLSGPRGLTENFPGAGSPSAGDVAGARDGASEAPTGDRQPYVVSGVTTA